MPISNLFQSVARDIIRHMDRDIDDSYSEAGTIEYIQHQLESAFTAGEQARSNTAFYDNDQLLEQTIQLHLSIG